MTFEQFLGKMNNTNLYFNDFQRYLSKNGAIVNLTKSKPLVKRYLAAEFAKQLFDEQKYYEIILKEDMMIKVVLDIK